MTSLCKIIVYLLIIIVTTCLTIEELKDQERGEGAGDLGYKRRGPIGWWKKDFSSSSSVHIRHAYACTSSFVPCRPWLAYTVSDYVECSDHANYNLFQLTWNLQTFSVWLRESEPENSKFTYAVIFPLF